MVQRHHPCISVSSFAPAAPVYYLSVRVQFVLVMGLGIGGQPLRFSVQQHMICVATVLHCAVRHRGEQKTVSLCVACDGVAASPLCKLCFGHDGSTAGNSVRLEDSSNISAS
jgi:hypothetical protein